MRRFIHSNVVITVLSDSYHLFVKNLLNCCLFFHSIFFTDIPFWYWVRQFIFGQSSRVAVAVTQDIVSVKKNDVFTSKSTKSNRMVESSPATTTCAEKHKSCPKFGLKGYQTCSDLYRSYNETEYFLLFDQVCSPSTGIGGWSCVKCGICRHVTS